MPKKVPEKVENYEKCNKKFFKECIKKCKQKKCLKKFKRKKTWTEKVLKKVKKKTWTEKVL